jgi:hypothetical protein
VQWDVLEDASSRGAESSSGSRRASPHSDGLTPELLGPVIIPPSHVPLLHLIHQERARRGTIENMERSRRSRVLGVPLLVRAPVLPQYPILSTRSGLSGPIQAALRRETEYSHWSTVDEVLERYRGQQHHLSSAVLLPFLGGVADFSATFRASPRSPDLEQRDGPPVATSKRKGRPWAEFRQPPPDAAPGFFRFHEDGDLFRSLRRAAGAYLPMTQDFVTSPVPMENVYIACAAIIAEVEGFMSLDIHRKRLIRLGFGTPQAELAPQALGGVFVRCAQTGALRPTWLPAFENVRSHSDAVDALRQALSQLAHHGEPNVDLLLEEIRLPGPL